jgi:hypothetical protein
VHSANHPIITLTVITIVCMGLGLALAVIDRQQRQHCVESRVGYCQPDRTIVITCPTCKAAAAGI